MTSPATKKRRAAQVAGIYSGSITSASPAGPQHLFTVPHSTKIPILNGRAATPDDLVYVTLTTNLGRKRKYRPVSIRGTAPFNVRVCRLCGESADAFASRQFVRVSTENTKRPNQTRTYCLPCVDRCDKLAFEAGVPGITVLREAMKQKWEARIHAEGRHQGSK